ncbi:MAG: Dabb family protein [Anaerolineaceae bacterium]|nr:Dabb family protein [Anaerolineaceae bacterium]
MFTHLVLFKLKVNTPESRQTIHDLLEALPAQIPQITHYEVGINSVPSERAYDMSLISRFESQADLDIYAKHPAHVAALSVIVPLLEKSAVVDYPG